MIDFQEPYQAHNAIRTEDLRYRSDVKETSLFNLCKSSLPKVNPFTESSGQTGFKEPVERVSGHNGGGQSLIVSCQVEQSSPITFKPVERSTRDYFSKGERAEPL
jgi:hypothetical protein